MTDIVTAILGLIEIDKYKVLKIKYRKIKILGLKKSYLP